MEGCVGEESFQMWELNRRLEAYLTRVKTLEEQNQLLSAELGGLRAQSGDTSWRARADDELASLRILVDQRWREKHEAEVQRDNLAEELESVAGRCQQVRLARERTVEEAACSRRALEAEKNARGWLSTQAAELERELEALRAAHEEERAHLNAQAACAPRRPPAPPHGSPVRAPEVEDLARRLGEVWRGAVRDYQERVAHMESSLGQARERLSQAVRGARECRLEVQQLQADRDSLQERREALEQRLEGRWQDRLQATDKFQLAVEALEQEKQGLQSQIAQILEGGQQLAHLKMSLSLEVATYRTLLEAENSRLQTPGRGSQASLGFLDPKLKPHFLGIPEDQYLGSVLPALSPTSFPSPLPNTLETPVTAFLKTQEFLQARTPTLASTPIPPISEAPCPPNAEVRAQEVPLSLLQTQAPEPLWAEATVPSSSAILPELEEPGGKQQGHFPDDLTSLATTLNPHHPTLEAKDGESSESRVSSIFQEDEGQIWDLVEKEADIEVKVENSSAQKTQESGLDTEETQDSQGPLQKETLKALGEEPLMSLKIQNYETAGKENCNSSTEGHLGTLEGPEKEKQTPLKSLEEKNVESEKTLENGVPELSELLGKEDTRTEDQELMSPKGTLKRFSSLGKESQEVVRPSKEGNLESWTAFKEVSPHPLGFPGAEDQMLERLVEKEDQSFPRSPEEEDQEACRPLQKENQEPLGYEEAEGQILERLIEKESQESLRSAEEEDQEACRSLQKENQEPLGYEEAEDQMLERLIEKESQESLRSAEEEDREARRSLQKENQEPLGYEEAEDQMLERLIEKESQESLRSAEEEEDQEACRSLQKENQEPLGYEEAEDQMLERLIEKESQESLKSPEENQRIGKPLERENQKSLRSLEENQETFVPLESRNQRPLRSLEVEEEEQRIVKPLEKVSQDSLGSLAEENVQPLRYLEEDDCINKSLLEDKTHKSLGSLEDRNGDSIIIPQESETQVSLRPPEEEDQRIVNHLEKESQEFSRSSEEEEQVMERSLEGENHESLSSVEKEDQMVESQLEKESQDSGKSLEDESQETFGPLEKENAESLRSLAGQDQEEQKLEQETQQTLRTVGNEQMAVSPPEKVDPELPKPLGNDQEIARSLGKENQESLVSLKEKGIETVKSLETEIIEPLETAEEDLERRKSIDTQEPLWSTEVARETVEPPEDEPPGSLGSVDENRETLTSLEKESQELSCLGKWNVETRVEDSQQCLQVEEGLQEEQHQESLREVKQELPSSGNQQRWEDVVEGEAVGQEAPLATTGVGTEDKAELHLRGQGGEEEAAAEGELLQDIVGEAWSLGSSEPKEQRVPAEALDNLEGGALEVPVAQSMPEVTERDEDRAHAGEQDSIEVTLGLEAARTGLELEQEVVGLEDPRHFAREEAIPPSLGEESVKAKIAQGLEGPGKEPKEAGALDPGILELPKTSSEALECQGHKESESMEGWEEEEASLETSDHEGSDAPQPRPPETEEDEGAQAALTAPGPKLLEPCSPIPILTDAHELQPQAEGIQEAGWQPEAGSEALERVENEPEFGLGEIPEGLQDWEEGREESEADDLGETLPDSTPLGLYLRSPASPKWDLAGEQRLSPQGDAGKEDWGPAVPAAQGLSGSPEEEEEQGHGSDLSSEEFEDLGTEASLLPGVPKEVADHVGQVPPVLQPACWDQGGESDGFADEEESGEEGEEEDADEEGAESGAQWWGSGASGGGCKVQDIAQRGDPVQESVGVSGLWDDGLRGAAANVPALEMVSQDSAEPSGSEESESASLEGEEGQVTDHLDAPQEVTSMVPGVGDAFDIGGQGPNLDSEQVNGKMENGLEQAEGQVVLDGDEDQGLPLQGQEVGALKVPLVASPVHLGPSQPLKFTLSGVDGDSWSSGED